MAQSVSPGRIRVGIGGWSYEPWRQTFYPPEIKAAQELEYASRQVTAIEINSTFYRLQKPAVFAKWRDATPDDFIFAIKAPRFIVQRKVLGESIPGVERFIESGIAELKHKLGPILWQLDPTHEYHDNDLRRFLEALPKTIGNEVMGARRMRHALNVRHASFKNANFIELARQFGVAVVFEDDEKHPAIADVTADFVYARLRRSVASQSTGYTKPALTKWAQRAISWANGRESDELQRIHTVDRAKEAARDVYVFFINGAKERAPAAAQTLIAELDSLGKR
jgi:uncharacterized protein YecE (DUF72 family)